MNIEFNRRTNTLEYVSDLAVQFEQEAWFGKEYAGVGPTDGRIIAMGLRLLAAQLPGEAALARAEAMAAAVAQIPTRGAAPIAAPGASVR